jgi:hypothetical protein
MKFTKRYNPRTLNFHLLPDLMTQVKESVPDSMLIDAGEELELHFYFLLKTISQTASTFDAGEFRDILRSLTEPILSLDAQLAAYYKQEDLSKYESEPPAFELKYRPDSVEIILAKNTADNIKRLFSAIEEALSLESIKPIIKDEGSFTRKRTAFIAHSFDQIGKSYAYELIKFLNLLRFEVSTGEGYSPERISKKVKDRLTSQEIVIVIALQER